MTHLLLPPVWLIVAITGLSHLSETVYTPALPDIARAFHSSDSMVEYTLTIYLVGFAAGAFFWGNLSDRVGRKPCILAGLIIFVLGCMGCYFSESIFVLMAYRFVQAFGGSVGSVLGQAMSRDSFHGPALGRVYSSTGTALSIFPAVGPVLGGLIAEYASWESIFLFLIFFAVVLAFIILPLLPETHHAEKRQPISLVKVGLRLLKDKKVLGFGLIVGACRGISFCYFAEGSFYLIKLLGLSPSEYGFTFIAIASSSMLGGILSKKLHSHHTSRTIMGYGLVIVWAASTFFSALALIYTHFYSLSSQWMVGITLLSQMAIMFGSCMVNSNALALALVDYKDCIGTASSLFGFFYYVFVSLFSLGMGVLHNGTLLPMPLYFLWISAFMLAIQRLMISKDKLLK